jgi:phosphoglycerate kinase
MNYKTLDDFYFKGKRVLLRCDINSEIEKGKVILSDRIVESAKTIKELQKKKAKVVVLGHQGQPGKSDFISLKQHGRLLNKFVKIKFVPDTIGKKALDEIGKLKDGQALLLENVRFVDDEFKPSDNNKLIKNLAGLFDVYVNDAFSVCHREQTSIVSFPKLLPSAVGRTMERELRSLEKLGVEETLFVLGGAKVEGSIKLIARAKRVLATGVLAFVVLKARGYEIGKTEEIFKEEMKFVEEIKKFEDKIVVPIDFAFEINGKRKELSLKDLPSELRLQDIGKESVKLFAEEIGKAKSVFMSGTAGVCESKIFREGTEGLFRAIMKSKAFSVLGGGNTISAMEEMKISRKKFGYVSLSGGALESYVAGEKLPGLEVLKEK